MIAVFLVGVLRKHMQWKIQSHNFANLLILSYQIRNIQICNQQNTDQFQSKNIRDIFFLSEIRLFYIDLNIDDVITKSEMS